LVEGENLGAERQHLGIEFGVLLTANLVLVRLEHGGDPLLVQSAELRLSLGGRRTAFDTHIRLAGLVGLGENLPPVRHALAPSFTVLFDAALPFLQRLLDLLVHVGSLLVQPQPMPNEPHVKLAPAADKDAVGTESVPRLAPTERARPIQVEFLAPKPGEGGSV